MKDTWDRGAERSEVLGVPGTRNAPAPALKDPDGSPIEVHQAPTGFSDGAAPRIVRIVRVFADAVSSKRHGHRAVMLETAAVPGMVGGLLRHLKAIRDDRRWIKVAIDEADDARLRDVAIVIRADEAGRRDKNHVFANEIAATGA